MPVYEDTFDHADADHLVQHTRRPQWGRGVLVQDEGDRRHYQFEDGRLRIFKEGWFGLLQPVDCPVDEMEDVLQDLDRQRGRAIAQAEIRKRRRKGDLSALRFVDQLRIFRSFHPEGFEDEGYIEEYRTREGKPLRKGHIDRALATARSLLPLASVPTMSADQLHTVATKVMSDTNLVSPSSDVKPFKTMEAGFRPQVARALEALLMLEEDTEDRVIQRTFDQWTQSLFDAGIKPSWSLTTTLPALVRPQWHISVKSSVFRMQAKWMAPGRSWDTTPSGALYVRMLRMAKEIRERLENEGITAQDNFDVTRFVWITLRPKGKKRLESLVSGDSEE